jgi:K+-transporting ATPase KdpF subunit
MGNLEYLIGGVITVAVFCYLLYALVRPEQF